MAEVLRGFRDVRTGAAVVAVLLLLLLFFWGQRGRNPFADAYSLVLFVEDARGLQEGDPVSLSGLRVGEVGRIDVLMGRVPGDRFPARAPRMNIRIVLEIDQRFREEITTRSRARIGSLGVSGARYIRIEKGPVGGEPLESGGRILPVPAALDAEFMLAKATEVSNRIAAANRHSEELGEKLESGAGTLGRFLVDPADNPVAESFEDMNVHAARVLRKLDHGEGTIGVERRTRRIRENATALRESVQRIERKLAEDGGSLAAFASDPALPQALARLEATLDRLVAKLDSGEGSLGRFVNDPELFEQLRLLTVAIDSLKTQVAKDPLGSINIELD